MPRYARLQSRRAPSDVDNVTDDAVSAVVPALRDRDKGRRNSEQQQLQQQQQQHARGDGTGLLPPPCALVPWSTVARQGYVSKHYTNSNSSCNDRNSKANGLHRLGKGKPHVYPASGPPSSAPPANDASLLLLRDANDVCSADDACGTASNHVEDNGGNNKRGHNKRGKQGRRAGGGGSGDGSRKTSSPPPPLLRGGGGGGAHVAFRNGSTSMVPTNVALRMPSRTVRGKAHGAVDADDGNNNNGGDHDDDNNKEDMTRAFVAPGTSTAALPLPAAPARAAAAAALLRPVANGLHYPHNNNNSSSNSSISFGSGAGGLDTCTAVAGDTMQLYAVPAGPNVEGGVAAGDGNGKPPMAMPRTPVVSPPRTPSTATGTDAAFATQPPLPPPAAGAIAAATSMSTAAAQPSAYDAVRGPGRAAWGRTMAQPAAAMLTAAAAAITADNSSSSSSNVGRGSAVSPPTPPRQPRRPSASVSQQQQPSVAVLSSSPSAAAAPSPPASSSSTTATPYDFRVVLSSGHTSQQPIVLSVGSGSVQGMRPTMEDTHFAHLAHCVVREQPVSLLGVLDGHCGSRVAHLAARCLPEFFFAHSALGDNNALALTEAILQTDRAIYHELLGGCQASNSKAQHATGGAPLAPHPPGTRPSRAAGRGNSHGSNNGNAVYETSNAAYGRDALSSSLTLTSSSSSSSGSGGVVNGGSLGGWGSGGGGSGGSTLIAAAVHGRMLYVACLGDARAVLYDGRTTIAMSEDHKPGNVKEASRIARCGGFVQLGRVCGVLAVSRALGDYEFKFAKRGSGGGGSSGAARVCSPTSTSPSAAAGGGGHGHNSNSGNAMRFSATNELMVSNVADVRQLHLTDESQFLLLACDGLWDVLSNDEATQFVKDFLAYTPDLSRTEIVRGLRPRPTPQTVATVLSNCCQKLAEFAVDRGSMDNVSVMLLFFHDVVDVVAGFAPHAATSAATVTASSSTTSSSLLSLPSARHNRRPSLANNNNNNGYTPRYNHHHHHHQFTAATAALGGGGLHVSPMPPSSNTLNSQRSHVTALLNRSVATGNGGNTALSFAQGGGSNNSVIPAQYNGAGATRNSPRLNHQQQQQQQPSSPYSNAAVANEVTVADTVAHMPRPPANAPLHTMSLRLNGVR